MIAQLIGKPAPELQKIKGWENGGPVKLSDLCGKVVVLISGVTVWALFAGDELLEQTYRDFHDKGLEVIAVHDDSVASIAEMDQKLAENGGEWEKDGGGLC